MGRVGIGEAALKSSKDDTFEIVVSAVNQEDAGTIAKYKVMRERKDISYKEIEVKDIQPKAQGDMWVVTCEV